MSRRSRSGARARDKVNIFFGPRRADVRARQTDNALEGRKIKSGPLQQLAAHAGDQHVGRVGPLSLCLCLSRDEGGKRKLRKRNATTRILLPTQANVCAISVLPPRPFPVLYPAA